MRKSLPLLLSLILGIILFYWITNIIGWKEIKNAFLVFSYWQGLIVLLITISVALVGALRWKEVLKGEGVLISLKDVIKPYLAGSSIVFLTPVIFWGDEVFQGYALKEKYSVPWTKGIASIAIERILEYTGKIPLIFFSILFFIQKISPIPPKVVIILGGIFLLLGIFIIIFYFKAFKKESIVRFFLRTFSLLERNGANSVLDIEKEIFNFFHLTKTTTRRAFGLTFLRVALMILRTWVLILFLGKNLGILATVFILGFSYLATSIPIPAALGSHEAFQVLAFNSLGLGAQTAAAFAIIIRVSELIIALIGLWFLFRLGTGILAKNILKD